MRLVYLYLKKYGPFNDRGFTFDSNYRVEHSRKTGEISVFGLNAVPDDFFSHRATINEDGDGVPSSRQGDVQVSAIIGRNGSGKTSIIRALFEIVEQSERESVLLDFGEEIELVYRIDYLLVTLEKGKLKLYQSMPGHLNGEAEKAREAYNLFKGCVDLFYYSPYYHPDHLMPNNKENCTFDISTSNLLFELTGEEGDNTFVKLPSKELFKYREMMRIIEFLKTWKSNDACKQQMFSMSIPKGIVVISEHGAMERFERFVGKSICRDSRYRKLGDILHAVDSFYNSLIAYVADSLNWHYYAEELHGMPLPGEISDVESRLLDIFIGLGMKLHFHPDTPMDEEVSINERLSLFGNALDELDNISFDGMAIDRGDYRDGLEIFRLLLNNMNKYKDLQIGGIITFPTCDDELVKDLGAILELQVKARGFWKTDYIRFEFECPASSGEFAYVSMYSRIYHYLQTLVEETGDASRDVVLFLDEAEATLHPDLQRQLVANTISFCKVFFPNVKFHLIFSSHSPMLLSDIPSGNVVWLQSETDEDFNTFGANIFDLYRLAFNQSNGTMGEFAANKIKDALVKVSEVVASRVKCSGTPNELKVLDDDTKQVLSQIGDPIIRKYIDGLKAGGLI